MRRRTTTVEPVRPSALLRDGHVHSVELMLTVQFVCPPRCSSLVCGGSSCATKGSGGG